MYYYISEHLRHSKDFPSVWADICQYAGGGARYAAARRKREFDEMRERVDRENRDRHWVFSGAKNIS